MQILTQSAPGPGTLTDPVSAFQAHKNGSGQNVASSAVTTISWGTEAYDVGSEFASDTYTPVYAGKYYIEAAVHLTAMGTGTTAVKLHLYKNGVLEKTLMNLIALAGLTDITMQGSYIGNVAAGDAFTTRIEFVGLSAGNGTIDGTATATWFSGIRIIAPTNADLVALNNTWTGTNYFSSAFGLNGVISPAQITADQNDYAPTGHATASVWRLDANAVRTITGIAGGVAGRIIILQYPGASNGVRLAYDSGSSAAANRIKFPYTATGINVTQDCAVILKYDGVASFWNVIGTTFVQADQTAMEGLYGGQVAVTPQVQHHHPGHPKTWVQGTPNSTTIITSYNVTSLGDTATGQQTVTIATDFSSASYCVLVTVGDTSTLLVKSATVMTKAAGSYIKNSVVEAGSGLDPSSDWNSVGFGDHA